MSTDSWPAFIDATRAVLTAADRGLAFDKLHVVGDVSDAVDQVHRAEHRALRAEGRDGLVRCKGLWLPNAANMILEQWRAFEELRHSALKTARAWAIKEHAMSLWHYLSRTRAEKAWRRWYIRAIRSRPESVEQVERTIKTHLWGILNAVVLRANNGDAESIDGRVQLVKARSRGLGSGSASSTRSTSTSAISTCTPRP